MEGYGSRQGTASKVEARVNEHDRQIAAIRKLILTGMKMISEARTMAKENRAEIKALIASQRETDRMLQRFIRSLKRRTAVDINKLH